MLLKDLNDRDFDVVIVQTNSVKLHTFIKDKIKRRCKSNQDTIIEVKTKSDLKNVRSVTGVLPPFADRWFVDVNLSGVTVKDLVDVIASGVTCAFFVTTERYKDYKELKEALKKRNITHVLDYYINYLKRLDFIYLYDAFVPEKNRMLKSLFDYVVQSYSGDIEAVFDLFLEMGNGKSITNRKQIADICGIGGLSIESFIFMLLKEPSQTEKGLRKVMKLRIQAGRELGEVYKWRTFYNFLKKSLTNMVEVKMLRISGVVYKSIHNLPNGYDDKTLSRYQKYIWRLNEIPLSRILRLLDTLGNKSWGSDVEFVEFIYKYYTRMYTDSTITKEMLALASKV